VLFCVSSELKLKAIELRRQALVLGLEKSNLFGTSLNVLTAIEDSLLKLGDFSLVNFDLFDVLAFDEGLLTLDLFVFPFQTHYFKAEVVELLLHFLAFDEFFTQLGHSFISLE
jgi:hypothetical protein